MFIYKPTLVDIRSQRASETIKMMETIQVEWNGQEKDVLVYNKGTWHYDGITSEKLKELNEDLFNKVNSEVAKYIENFAAIQEKERQEKKAQEKLAFYVKVDEFKLEVEQHKDLLVGYETTFAEYSGYNSTPRMMDIKNLEAKYYVSGNVYYDKSYSYESGKDKSLWVSNVNYKNRRYTTLGACIKKTIERIQEKESALKTRDESEIKLQADNKAKEDFATEHGFKLGYDYTSMSKEGKYNSNVVAKIIIKDGIVKIINVEIKQEISIEELNSIVDKYEVKKNENTN